MCFYSQKLYRHSFSYVIEYLKEVIKLIFQHPLTDSYSYSASIEHIGGFPLHRHYELEFLYCTGGEVSFCSGAEKFTLHSGDIAVIGSLVPHEYLPSGENEVLVAEIGPMLLKNNFSQASQVRCAAVLGDKSDEKYISLFGELDAIYRIRKSALQNSELYVTGCLYKAAAAAVKYYGNGERSEKVNGNYYDVEEALTLIHTNYHRKLTVNEAAQKAMMAPANFCAAFKKITGMGFHEYLNFYRVRNARFMLEQTDESIQEIAAASGFSDLKTFYRVFKNSTGLPPGEYKKSFGTED